MIIIQLLQKGPSALFQFPFTQLTARSIPITLKRHWIQYLTPVFKTLSSSIKCLKREIQNLYGFFSTATNPSHGCYIRGDRRNFYTGYFSFLLYHWIWNLLFPFNESWGWGGSLPKALYSLLILQTLGHLISVLY